MAIFKNIEDFDLKGEKITGQEKIQVSAIEAITLETLALMPVFKDNFAILKTFTIKNGNKDIATINANALDKDTIESQYAKKAAPVFTNKVDDGKTLYPTSTDPSLNAVKNSDVSSQIATVNYVLGKIIPLENSVTTVENGLILKAPITDPIFKGTPKVQKGNRNVDLATVDLITSYTLPVATSNDLGGIKVGFTNKSNQYAVKLDSSQKAYVEVPKASSSALGLIKANGYTDSEFNKGVKTIDSGEAYITLNGATKNNAGIIRLGQTPAEASIISRLPLVGSDTDPFVDTSKLSYINSSETLTGESRVVNLGYAINPGVFKQIYYQGNPGVSYDSKNPPALFIHMKNLSVSDGYPMYINDAYLYIHHTGVGSGDNQIMIGVSNFSSNNIRYTISSYGLARSSTYGGSIQYLDSVKVYGGDYSRVIYIKKTKFVDLLIHFIWMDYNFLIMDVKFMTSVQTNGDGGDRLYIGNI